MFSCEQEHGLWNVINFLKQCQKHKEDFMDLNKIMFKSLLDFFDGGVFDIWV